MNTIVCTSFSPRDLDCGLVLPNHARLQEVFQYYWLANGIDDAAYGKLLTFANAFQRAGKSVTVWRCRELLPIARAYNHLLQQVDDQFADALILQDDVTAPANLVHALRKSRYDLPAAWHENKPNRDYVINGLDYVVFMAVLIRRRVFERLGYLNELFIRGVDAEYGCRASFEGLSVGHITEAHVHHWGERTTHGNNTYARMIHQQALAMIQFLHRRNLLRGKCGTALNARWNIQFTKANFA